MSRRPALVTGAVWLVLGSLLVVVPGGFVRFVFGKVLFAAAAVLLASMVRDAPRLPPRLLWGAAGFMSWFIVAAVASPSPVASLLGRWPRYEGLPMLLVYAGCALVGARCLGSGGDRTRTLVLPAAVVSTVLAALSALEAIGVSPLAAADVSRTGGTLGNATDQGAVALMLLAVLLDALVAPGRARTRWFAGVGAVGAAATICASGSRGVVLGLVVTLVVLAAGRMGRFRRTGSRLPGTGAALAGVALLVVVGGVVLASRGFATGTVTGRWVLWRASWQVVQPRLLTGVGPSAFVDALPSALGREWVERVGVANPPDSPHLFPLQLLAAGGVPLLVVATLLVGVGLRVAWGQRQADLQVGMIAALAGYGAVLLTAFTTPGPVILAAFLVGAVVAQPPGSVAPTTRTSDIRQASVAILAAAAVVWAAAGCAAEVALQRGVVAALRGDVESAERAFDWARHARPGDAEVCGIAAQSLAVPASHGDRRAAVAVIRHSDCALSVTSDAVPVLVARAVALTTLGRPDQARVILDRSSRLSQTSPAVYRQRAVARLKLGDLTGAALDDWRADELEAGRWPGDCPIDQCLPRP